MSGYKKLFFSVLCSLMSWAAAAQFHAQASLDTTSMMIGDTMRLHLTVQADAGWRVADDGLGAMDSIGSLERLRTSDWFQNERGETERMLTFSVYDSGHYWVPSLLVTFEKDGQTVSARTNSLPLAVYYPEADSTLAEIKDIRRTDMTWEDAVPYVLGALGVVALAWLISWWMNRRKQQKAVQVTQKPVVILPHERAFGALNLLRRSFRAGAEVDGRAFYTELTRVLRTYMEEGLQVPAMESTTEEVLEMLPNDGAAARLRGEMSELFRTAEFAKFAKIVPPNLPFEAHLNLSELFVEITKPIPEPDNDRETAA